MGQWAWWESMRGMLQAGQQLQRQVRRSRLCVWEGGARIIEAVAVVGSRGAGQAPCPSSPTTHLLASGPSVVFWLAIPPHHNFSCPWHILSVLPLPPPFSLFALTLPCVQASKSNTGRPRTSSAGTAAATAGTRTLSPEMANEAMAAAALADVMLQLFPQVRSVRGVEVWGHSVANGKCASQRSQPPEFKQRPTWNSNSNIV